MDRTPIASPNMRRTLAGRLTVALSSRAGRPQAQPEASPSCRRMARGFGSSTRRAMQSVRSRSDPATSAGGRLGPESKQSPDPDRAMHRCQLDLDDPPSPAARLVETGVHGEAIEPRIEPVEVPKLREVPAGLDQPLLDRIACELRVPEDEASSAVQPHDGLASKLGEGVMIASPCTLHESSLVHVRLVCRHGRMVVRHRVWRAIRLDGSCRWQKAAAGCRASLTCGT